MKYRNRNRSKILASFSSRMVLILIITIIYVSPFFWMLSTSLKADHDLFLSPPKLIPSPLIFQNYKKALEYFPFFRYFRNSLVITFGTILGTLLSCSLVAYSFSKLRWWGRNFFFYVMIGTVMIPFVVTVIPQFIIFVKLGWINTFLPLIIPSFFGTPLYIFLIRQFFSNYT